MFTPKESQLNTKFISSLDLENQHNLFHMNFDNSQISLKLNQKMSS